MVLFTVRNNTLLVRLHSVHKPPYFLNSKGLPGGLIDSKETAEQAAKRLIKSKALVDYNKAYLEQLYTFSGIERDPRGRVVAVAYMALLPWKGLSPTEQGNTGDVWWSPLAEARRLAYDHDQIIKVAVDRLRSKSSYSTLLGKLMPEEFTLTDLETIYKSILGTSLDKRNFRKKILKLKILRQVPGKRARGRFRPARIYRFASKKVQEIEII